MNSAQQFSQFYIGPSYRFTINKKEKTLFIFDIDRAKAVEFEAETPYLEEAIHGLFFGRTTELELEKIVRKDPCENSLQRWFFFIGTLKKECLLAYTLGLSDGTLTINSIREENPMNQTDSSLQTDWSQPIQLSRFAYLKTHDSQLVLESPLSNWTVHISSNVFLKTLSELAKGLVLNEFIHNQPHLGPEIRQIISFLLYGKFLNSVDDDLKTWEFHDALFHDLSRLGRKSDKCRFGATYRFKNDFQHNKSYPASQNEQTIQLSASNFKKSINESPLFTEVLESRRSIRTYGTNPLTIKELSDFLFQCARVCDEKKRLYPSSGGLYEIEFYLIIRQCDGLQAGLYAYDSTEHQLVPIKADQASLKEQLTIAQKAMGTNAQQPQVLITLTSKFDKIAYKYEGMSYRNTLFNVGCIIQTMYLVATAMKLAPCALGYGDSRKFATLIGASPWEKASVGEFALGSLF